jgi:Tfp pilus assembly protein PilF
MGQRLAWQLLVGLVLAGPLGCQTLPWFKPTETAAEATLDAGAGKEEKDLPPEESGRLCLATARQMEEKGAEVPAILLYEKARHDNPRVTAQASRRLAVLYDRQGDFLHALEEYQKALQENPRDSDVLNDLGYSYYNNGKLDEAEKALRRAVNLKPENKRAWVNLGLVLGAQHRYPESLEAFGKAVTEAQAQCNLAFLLTAEGKREEAKQTYERALRLDPNLVGAKAALERLNANKPLTPAPRSAEAGKQPPIPPSPPSIAVPKAVLAPPARPIATTPVVAAPASSSASSGPTTGVIRLDDSFEETGGSSPWVRPVDYRVPATAAATGTAGLAAKTDKP